MEEKSMSKKYFINVGKIVNSNNKVEFTTEEKKQGEKMLQIYRNAKTKYIGLCYRLKDGYVYKIYLPIERLTAQCRKNEGSSKSWGDYYFSSPLSKAQCEQYAREGKAKKLGSYEMLEALAKKYKFGNGGKAIEKMLARVEHKKFLTELPASLGSEYEGDSEIKYADMRTGSGIKLHCPNEQ